MNQPKLESNRVERRRWVLLTGIFLVLVHLSGGFALSTQVKEAASRSSTLLITIREFKSGSEGSFSTCIYVWDDGYFHFERRSQPISRPTTTAQIFDSSLPEAQRLELRRIVESDSIRELGPLQPLESSIAKTWVSGFQAEIVRQRAIQSVGYFEFGHHDMEKDADLDEVSDAQQKISLRPLQDWFHRVNSASLSLNPAEPTLCGNSGKE